MGAAEKHDGPIPFFHGRWPRLMGEIDAAEYLSIGTTMFRTLGLPARRVGRRVLYDRNDLDRWVDHMDGQPVESGQYAEAVADEERRFFEKRAKRAGN